MIKIDLLKELLKLIKKTLMRKKFLINQILLINKINREII